MRKLMLYTCFLASLSMIAYSCRKDSNDINEQQIRADIQDALLQIQAVQSTDLNIKTRIAAKLVVVEAGSNNALAQALTDASEGGIVYVRAGLHTETEGIVVSSKATIIGETGAVLKIRSFVSLMNLTTGVTDIYAGLHVLNAPQTLIANLEIQPIDSNGSTAILFENAPLSAVMNCTIKSFMFSVMVEKSDQTSIMGNVITGSTLWQFNPGLMAGIANLSGVGTWIANNDIQTTFAGIFLSDQKGKAVKNKVKKGHHGVVLCHIIPNSIKLPKGNKTGGEYSTNSWTITDNQSNDNKAIGFLVVDGSYSNILSGNTTSGNGLFDIHLTKDSTKYSPSKTSAATHDNTVIANSTQKVKDCGINNHVTGGQKIDTAIDKCD